MKLDTKAMRHLTAEDWGVLTAVPSCALSALGFAADDS